MTEHKPAIPTRARDIVYFVLLGGAALSLAAQGLAPVWAPEALAEQISDSAQVLTSVMALIGGGLGVAYRPGRTGGVNGSGRTEL